MKSSIFYLTYLLPSFFFCFTVLSHFFSFDETHVKASLLFIELVLFRIVHRYESLAITVINDKHSPHLQFFKQTFT